MPQHTYDKSSNPSRVVRRQVRMRFEFELHGSSQGHYSIFRRLTKLSILFCEGSCLALPMPPRALLWPFRCLRPLIVTTVALHPTRRFGGEGDAVSGLFVSEIACIFSLLILSVRLVESSSGLFFSRFSVIAADGGDGTTMCMCSSRYPVFDQCGQSRGKCECSRRSEESDMLFGGKRARRQVHSIERAIPCDTTATTWS